MSLVNLNVVREEQCSPAMSTHVGDKSEMGDTDKPRMSTVKPETHARQSHRQSHRQSVKVPDLTAPSNILQDKCPCQDDIWGELVAKANARGLDPEVIDEILGNREAELREEFHETLTAEVAHLKETFDYILHNEQVRASYMLREAYRERQEKIKALQAQLECKNLAGLMYVMCSERRKCKMEKMQLIEQYSAYIDNLHDILSDGQQTILKLSRGYKTAAKLDLEWREKMKSIIGEFQKFVEHYLGESVDSCQYFFDIPRLMQTNAPKEDDVSMDPIDEEPPPPQDISEKPWWANLDGDCRPFVMFGDMEEFDPPKRRETLKHVKAKKTAPKRWKEYAFHDMFLKSNCVHASAMKDIFIQRAPSETRWECQGVQTDAMSETCSRRVTTTSIDIRGGTAGGTMGSILRLITGPVSCSADAKATLLGAVDSMEIVSTTRLRDSDEKIRKMNDPPTSQMVVKLPVGRRRTSFFEERRYFDTIQQNLMSVTGVESQLNREVKPTKSVEEDEAISTGTLAPKIEHHDSLTVIPHHQTSHHHRPIPEPRICPMEECRRRRVDSFMHSLPSYMRLRPFTHVEQSYEGYQACTPEQLEVLQQRIQARKMMEKKSKMSMVPTDVLGEWNEKPDGVATQTSFVSLSNIPPCNCKDESSEGSAQGLVVNMLDLLPVKLKFDEIAAECFYDSRIECNRFQVVGEESNDSMKPDPIYEPKDFTSKRLYMIKNILKEHPSLCSLFQANAKC